ncbi:MAG: PAS domain-containing protein [Firmicutes bacterium]|nr:PAS domain-containing protein [Bacillota bacterium]
MSPQTRQATRHLKRFLWIWAATGLGAGLTLLVGFVWIPSTRAWRTPISFTGLVSIGLFALFALTRYSVERTARRLLLGAAYASLLVVTMIQVSDQLTDPIQGGYGRSLWLAAFVFVSSRRSVGERVIPPWVAGMVVTFSIMLGRAWAAVDFGAVESSLGAPLPFTPAIATILFFLTSHEHVSRDSILDTGLAVTFSLYGWTSVLVEVNPFKVVAPGGAFLVNTFGAVFLLLSAGWDVMNLMQVEREVADYNRRSRLVIDRIPCGFMLLDGSGAVTIYNPAAERLLGIPAPEILGQRLGDLAGRLPAEFDLIGQVLSQGTEYHDAEIEVRCASGPRYWSLTARPIGKGAGAVEGAVVVLEDFTDRKQLSARVAAGERLASIGHLAASVAHEIRNPLAAIKGLLHLAVPTVPRRMAGSIQACAGLIDEVEMVVSQVLSLVRPRVPVLGPVKAGGLIEAVLSDFLGRYASRGVKWTCDARSRPVMVDEEALRQALVNIVGGVAEALPAGASVTVTADTLPEQEWVVLRLEFPGIVIPGGGVETVFDPAFTIRGAHLGFGLSVGKKLLEECGARVEALAADKGFTLLIKMPPAPGGVADDVGDDQTRRVPPVD